MKKRHLLVFMLFTLLACQKDKKTLLSPQDKSVIEQMDIWLKNTSIYYDSIQMCCNSTLSCDENEHRHYDEMLHYCDSMYQSYHNQFSHDEGHCDHNHQGMGGHMGNMHNNGMMMHSHDDADNHTDQHNHMFSEHQEMQDMMDSHCHP